MMRDGDVLELVPTMERAQKYDSEIFKWLARLTSFLLQNWHFHGSCTVVGRSVPISSRDNPRLHKIPSVRNRTGTA